VTVLPKTRYVAHTERSSAAVQQLQNQLLIIYLSISTSCENNDPSFWAPCHDYSALLLSTRAS
jgi:hypothetical protein